MNVKVQEDFFEQFTRNEDLIVFLYLLLKSDVDGNVYTSLRELSSNVRIPINTLRTTLKNLEVTQRVTQHPTQHPTQSKSYISICNIESYYTTKKVTPHSTPHNTPHSTPHAKELTQEEKIENDFQERMKGKYPNLSKLKKPLSLAQYYELRKMVIEQTHLYEHQANEFVIDQLELLDEWIKGRGRTDAYSNAKNWFIKSLKTINLSYYRSL